MGADRNDQKNERVESYCSEAWNLLQSISCCFGGFDSPYKNDRIYEEMAGKTCGRTNSCIANRRAHGSRWN